VRKDGRSQRCALANNLAANNAADGGQAVHQNLWRMILTENRLPLFGIMRRDNAFLGRFRQGPAKGRKNKLNSGLSGPSRPANR
jgi:hypothetical protein